MLVEVDISGIKETIESLRETPKRIIKARDRTFKRLQKRLVGITTDAVSKTYKVKKGLFRDALESVITTQSDKMRVLYKGKLLTPMRFDHTPTKPPSRTKTGKQKKYTPTATFFIGSKKKLKPQMGADGKRKPVFIGSSGAQSEDKIQYVFFMRTGRKHFNKKQKKKTERITSIKTTSIPQMIGNKDVSVEIQKQASDFFIKRFEHEVEFIQGGTAKK